MGGTCGCFSFLVEDAPKALKAVEGTGAAPKPVPSQAPAQEAPEVTKEAPGPVDVAQWQVGKQGVSDISPSSDQRLLLRAPESGVSKDATVPADGAEVTLNLEIFELSAAAPAQRFSARGLRAQAGSGHVQLPEEFELIIPCVKRGGVFLAHSKKFGEFGPLPETGMWQSLSTCVDKEVLMKVELLEAQDLCLATLEGHERLEYAKGRKDAAAGYFKRGKYEAALERYSLAAEMLQDRADIKDTSLYSQAKEVRSACELNAAACLLKLEKWRDVEAVCNAILRTNPVNEKALFRRGKALLALGHGDRAEKDLKQVLEVNPNNTEAQKLLQQAKKESKGTQRERNVYAKMLQAD